MLAELAAVTIANIAACNKRCYTPNNLSGAMKPYQLDFRRILLAVDLVLCEIQTVHRDAGSRQWRKSELRR